MDKAVVRDTAESFGVRQRLFFGAAIRAWVRVKVFFLDTRKWL